MFSTGDIRASNAGPHPLPTHIGRSLGFRFGSSGRLIGFSRDDFGLLQYGLALEIWYSNKSHLVGVRGRRSHHTLSESTGDRRGRGSRDDIITRISYTFLSLRGSGLGNVGRHGFLNANANARKSPFDKEMYKLHILPTISV